MPDDKPKTESIEVIARRLKVRDGHLNGLLLRKGWAYGHQITEDGFKAELQNWLKGPTVAPVEPTPAAADLSTEEEQQ
ncbi:hypothetical protein [Deinococcus cellulosilyticus]|uniref:Uncharacterized protein n=1 Tax=Deinococcus cellulosilyticus (strain DSM 18568 / NBRC 106333 / KACC 11606 / 5516J-15) TaxID=1223518 RepID=A0A511NBT2_DEIC1|nr:hypothetical protein [Deinococcus cellulosilyticus]GEM50026.1 hypothetical protein DC3_56610 [Deinococcus cellulosilyticus NBRC 106333 = KACC 11606]